MRSGGYDDAASQRTGNPRISRRSFRLPRWPADGHLVADLSASHKDAPDPHRAPTTAPLEQTRAAGGASLPVRRPRGNLILIPRSE
jgi:hypothetical protein